MHISAADFDPANARRILVVDDDLPSALTLSLAMEMSGHQVRTCFDGSSALTCAKAFMPEVVLMAIGAPQMGGLEVCRQLRQDPALGQATIVAQTGWATEDMRQRTTAAGFDHHLIKPLDLTALLALIKDCPHYQVGTA